jgi:hypothetical protein
MITTADDFFHEKSDDPRWTETGWFGFYVPEREISGWLYMLHRRNMHHTLAGVCVVDPSGELPWDCLFHDWHDTLPLAPDADMFNYTADSSLTVSIEEPLGRYRFAYDASGLQLDLIWTAQGQPVETGLPGGMQDWAKGEAETGHFEQRGQMTGRITLDSLGGETLAIDCWSIRDRSWGVRHITPSTPRGTNPFAAGQDVSFFVAGTSPLALADDPLEDTVEQVNSGHFDIDGEGAPLVEGTYRCVERGDDGRPLRCVVEAKDALGRDLRAEACAFNFLAWNGYPHSFVWWSGARWQVNGRAALGDMIEWYPAQLARRWIRDKRGLQSALT